MMLVAGNLRVALGEGLGEIGGGAEIQQHDAASLLLVQVVGEIGVGLHGAEFKQLPEQQALQQGAATVAFLLQYAGPTERFQWNAIDKVHRQDALGGQVIMHLRHHEVGLAAH